jgi:hypothetical protein
MSDVSRKPKWIASSLVLCLAAWAGAVAHAEDTTVPDSHEVEDTVPEGSRLTGREIYERYLRNKYRRSTQKMRVISRDPGGSEQATAFEANLEDTRDEDDNAVGGVLAKMLIEVSSPFDMRHSRYLMISRDPGPDDEWVYQPSERRVRRTLLKRTPLMGTDYTFDDVAYHDIEHADYERLEDSEIDGVPVYVVEAIVKETQELEYYKTTSYMEKEHYVPLRVVYWDEFGVAMREMTAPHESIKAFGESWVSTESTMRDLMQRTSSSLFVEDVETDPVFHKKLFSLARMSRGN